MPNTHNTNRKLLEDQLTETISKLKEKLDGSHEDIVEEYINKYEDALNCLKNTSDKEMQKQKLLSLLNCTRGYLEHSSYYMQDFLDEMAKTEKMIKQEYP